MTHPALQKMLNMIIHFGLIHSTLSSNKSCLLLRHKQPPTADMDQRCDEAREKRSVKKHCVRRLGLEDNMWPLLLTFKTGLHQFSSALQPHWWSHDAVLKKGSTQQKQRPFFVARSSFLMPTLPTMQHNGLTLQIQVRYALLSDSTLADFFFFKL